LPPGKRIGRLSVDLGGGKKSGGGKDFWGGHKHRRSSCPGDVPKKGRDKKVRGKSDKRWCCDGKFRRLV